MENNIQIIGNEDNVIYSNLNRQFSNLKKVIITKDAVIDAFDGASLNNLIGKLKESSPDNYQEIIKESKEVFDVNVKSDLYTKIQDKLSKLSNNYMDVKLESYNFMNALSNSKFSITIRCEHFSITNYYIEKGAIISSIKNLVKDYFNYIGNIYRTAKIGTFQIEIYETEEIYKTILLKKENNSLILATNFGFLKNSPIDYSAGQEIYVSKGNDFKFFKNSQTTAILREHNRLVEKEINPQEKVLTNEELVLVNEKTKDIDDAIIEGYITSKGIFRINCLSVIENPIEKYSENGFIVSKSSNNYDRVSLLSLRDNFDEEILNPKYALLKNEGDIKEFMLNPKIVEKIDGIIITKNFYNKILDRIGKIKNIDIIYLNKNLSKSLDEKIDWENVDIESSIKSEGEKNPFGNILKEQNKEKDELLEKLKSINLELNTGNQQRSQNQYNQPNLNIVNNPSQIENVVNSIIGSDNSSFNNSGNYENQNNYSNNNNVNSTNQNQRGSNMALNNNGKDKKSAFDMLMDSAANQQRANSQARQQNNMPNMQQQVQQQVQNQMGNQMQQRPTQQQNMGMNQQYQQQNMQQQYPQNNNNMNGQYNGSNLGQQQMQNEQRNLNQYSDNSAQNQNIIQQAIAPVVSQTEFKECISIKEEITETIDISRYESVIATEIIGEPGIEADAYFADINTISEITGGKIYFLTLNPDEMQNPNLNYVIPIGINNEDIKGCHLLIKNPTDFFLIDEDQDVDYFINICDINDAIKKQYVNEIIKKVGLISVICMKKDLELIGKYIDKIEAIKVKDVESDYDLEEVKRKIISYEKRKLMRSQ